MSDLSRRAFLSAGALLLAGCANESERQRADRRFTPAPDSAVSPRLPGRVFGGYWRADIGMYARDTPSVYNLIYVFHAVPDGSSGELLLPSGMPADLDSQIAELRETRPVVLTAGGANADLQFSRRSVSDRFVRSVSELVDTLGVDGVDLNTYEDGEPNVDEYVWLAEALKDEHGPEFLVTTPPAPWSQPDLELCGAMVEAGVLDLVSPQYYDGPGLAQLSTIERYRDRWVAAVGASRLGTGLGLGDEQNFMTVEQCITAWQSVQRANLRGTYLWTLDRDREADWMFADMVADAL